MQKKLYILYLALIPFHLLFDFTSPISHISTFVAVLGLAMNHKYIPIRIFAKWRILILTLVFYMFSIASLTYSDWGVVNGETTFHCIWGNIVLYIVFLISVAYNIVGLTRLISREELIRIIKNQSVILLVTGLVQLAIIFNLAAPLISVYDTIADFTCLKNSVYLTGLNRGVTLWGSEPSSIASVLIYIVPFCILYEKNKKYKIMTMAWMMIFFLSGSTQAIVSFLVVLGCVLSIRFFGHVHRLVYIFAFLIGIILALFYTYGSELSINVGDNDLAMIIYGKAMDFDNLSVQMRESTVINDMKVFFTYPLTGIGDGIQGMLYDENIPNWVRYSYEVQEILSGRLGVVNGGGNFFPAFLSGFGLIGFLLLISFIKKYLKDIELLKGDFLFYNVFCIGMALFFLTGWQTVSIYNNEYMALLLSLPYLRYKYQMITPDSTRK